MIHPCVYILFDDLTSRGECMAITDKYGLFPDNQYQTHGLLRISVQKFHFLSKGLSANKSSVENVACTVQLYQHK